MAGLRERKTAATRQRILDEANRLFERDGFDAVTLAEIAEAADVSLKTVVNYSGAKEDLFFDAERPGIDDLLVAIAGRHERSLSLTEAVRPLLVDGPVLAGTTTWASIDETTWSALRRCAECERDSPTLTARRAALLQSWLVHLAERSGSAPWSAMLTGVLVLRHSIVLDGLVAGRSPAGVARLVRTAVGGALDALERGFAR
ncbi:helix-turn-helix domain-containing protein [Agromyces sp. G08B096]|uniref:Helix-turn-helix domain-containing protein n=1 Tax=Agromyces sp. G08B096 TaxID=3156399 RepID=A0AAU7W4J4_9MICO